MYYIFWISETGYKGQGDPVFKTFKECFDACQVANMHSTSVIHIPKRKGG